MSCSVVVTKTYLASAHGISNDYLETAAAFWGKYDQSTPFTINIQAFHFDEQYHCD